mgnify:CR=1 FL=1
MGGVDALFAEYEALMGELDELPEGRVMWEANRELNRYGTPMALMLLPLTRPLSSDLL